MIKLSRNGYHNENGEGPYIQLQPQLEWKYKSNEIVSPYTLAVWWKNQECSVIVSIGNERHYNGLQLPSHFAVIHNLWHITTPPSVINQPSFTMEAFHGFRHSQTQEPWIGPFQIRVRFPFCLYETTIPFSTLILTKRHLCPQREYNNDLCKTHTSFLRSL